MLSYFWMIKNYLWGRKSKSQRRVPYYVSLKWYRGYYLYILVLDEYKSGVKITTVCYFIQETTVCYFMRDATVYFNSFKKERKSDLIFRNHCKLLAIKRDVMLTYLWHSLLLWIKYWWQYNWVVWRWWLFSRKESMNEWNTIV